MNGAFLAVLAIPLLIPFIVKVVLRDTISWPEFGLHILVVCLLMYGGFELSKYQKSSDIQILNGRVVGKAKEKVSCEHSYTCNCRQSCSGKSCTTTCSTCYEHLWDYDWNVQALLGKGKSHVTTIDRIDRRGDKEPPRFTMVKIGEPYTARDSFTNYVKAVPDSLINTLVQYKVEKQFQQQLQSITYPSAISDYYRKLDRVMVIGPTLGPLSNHSKVASAHMSERLGTTGPKKKANLIVVLTDNQSPAFGQALSAKWLKGKMNDTLVFIGLGTPTGNKYPISWTHVDSWADKKLYQIELQDEIRRLGTISPENLNSVVDLSIDAIERGFVPKNPEDFKYLEDRIEPEMWALTTLGLIGILVSLGLTWLFHRHCLFGSNQYGSTGRGHRRFA